MASEVSAGLFESKSEANFNPENVIDPEAGGKPAKESSSAIDDKNDEFLVRFDENDKLNPINWSPRYRYWVTFQLSMLALIASLGSSITAAADPVIAEYIGVSQELAVLNVSLFVIGFACGPLIWAPLSEVWGRRWSLIPATYCLALFSVATGASHTATAVFVTRFFAGFFGSAPVSNVSAGLGDIFTREDRGTAMVFYGIAVVGGAIWGPVVGAAIVVNPHLGWRWVLYIEAIVVFVFVTLAAFCMPEMYPSVILKRKAQQLRKDTGDQRYYHPHEHLKVDFKSLVQKQLSRPLIMFLTEPAVTCVAFYASFVFTILYLTLEVFPIVFIEQRGYGTMVGSLPFCALFVGVICAISINLGNQPIYVRKCRAANGKPVPEARLPPMSIGAFLMVIGLFLFGWTADPKFHWAIPCVAAGFIGAGFNVIFQQSLNYLVDVYGLYAASAVAANTFLRSVMACGIPLAARPMFHALGVGPGMSILGGVASILLPIPFIFMRIGKTLRKRSKFAPVLDD